MDLEQIISLIGRLAEADRPVYLVGGAVRDRLLQRDCRDLDFVLPAPTGKLARRVADALDADFYVLDAERGTGRVIYAPPGGERIWLDFASLRADDLEGDLRARDFTINAMALRLGDETKLIDPCGGLDDLRKRRLRACGPGSLADDPLRVLRAVRQAVALDFQIEEQTLAQAREAAGRLAGVSPERLRDELMHMLEGRRASLCIRLLERLGGLPYLLPDVLPLRELKQSSPHVWDVWEHTLAVLDRLEDLLATLAAEEKADASTGLALGSAVLWLGRYRENFARHLAQPLPNGRGLVGILKLAALYHDTGKATTASQGEDGRLHFYGHAEVSAERLARQARQLAFSNEEIERCALIVREHMRIHQLADAAAPPTQRAVYRFFRASGEAGVDICLLSLADTWATYGYTLPQAAWLAELQTCRVLLEARWEKTDQVVSPPRLVDGRELMATLGLAPGRVVGLLLETIREAQAAGEVRNKEEAFGLAEQWLKDQKEGENGESER